MRTITQKRLACSEQIGDNLVECCVIIKFNLDFSVTYIKKKATCCVELNVGHNINSKRKLHAYRDLDKRAQIDRISESQIDSTWLPQWWWWCGVVENLALNRYASTMIMIMTPKKKGKKSYTV